MLVQSLCRFKIGTYLILMNYLQHAFANSDRRACKEHLVQPLLSQPCTKMRHGNSSWHADSLLRRQVHSPSIVLPSLQLFYRDRKNVQCHEASPPVRFQQHFVSFFFCKFCCATFLSCTVLFCLNWLLWERTQIPFLRNCCNFRLSELLPSS